MKKPAMIVIAGGNGAGKSTLYHEILAKYHIPFLNADEYLKSNGLDQNSKNTLKAQEEIRKQCAEKIQGKSSFCFETVFSHESKIELIKKAKENDFTVYLFYIHLSNHDLNVARVWHRVENGGHDVPEEKIRSRIPKTIKLIKQAKNLVDEMAIYDNSTALERVYTLKNGTESYDISTVPEWLKEIVED
ncbi:MAG: zeta toxin family protein [Bacteriovoracaceae bacterium]|nr:zeta toxin family protein [Bacteriovoracaceae bacterium]